MNGTNLNIVLTNSLCCISAKAAEVSKLYSIGSKCAKSEAMKLKLMNDWFEALRCYKADPIMSKFAIKLPYDEYWILTETLAVSSQIYYIIVNGVITSQIGDNSSSIVDMIGVLIAEAIPSSTINVIVDPDGFEPRYVHIYIDAACDTETIRYETRRVASPAVLTDSFDFIRYQEGYCTPINCLTEDNFNIIVDNLMNSCDICRCQLTE